MTTGAAPPCENHDGGSREPAVAVQSETVAAAPNTPAPATALTPMTGPSKAAADGKVKRAQTAPTLDARAALPYFGAP